MAPAEACLGRSQVVGASLEVLSQLQASTHLRDILEENTKYFREAIIAAGFSVKGWVPVPHWSVESSLRSVSVLPWERSLSLAKIKSGGIYTHPRISLCAVQRVVAFFALQPERFLVWGF